MYVIKLISAYTIIGIFSVAVFMLLAILIHLTYAYLEKHKSKEKQKQIRFFLLLTIVAIVLFEVTLILVIAVILQIILIDAHKLHKEEDWIDHVYYDAFEYMKYMIAICDTTAHLCVVLVFIARFQKTFHNNTIFAKQSGLIRLLYFSVTTLTMFGVAIVILMCIQHTITEIIILEIIWEILVDFMCLWILWLFMSKLYDLLKFSLQSHVKNGVTTRSNLLRQLIEATKASITNSKQENSNSGAKGKLNENKRSRNTPKSQNIMTIDGMKIEPFPISRKGSSKPGSSNVSPDASPGPSPDPSMHTEYKSHGNMELTITTIKALSDNDQTDHEQTDGEKEERERICSEMKGESSAIDLVGVMTKITLLVLFAVVVSVFGVIGNIFIEIEEMRYIEKHDIAIEELWAEILPVMDVVITSLMLYLQFNFTHRMYRKLLGKLDVWFLTNCLKFIEYLWERKITADESKTASFLYDTNETKTLEVIGGSNMSNAQ